MSGVIQIQIAKGLLEKFLGELITDINIDIEDPRIFAKLRDGSRLYIQFNDHDQYSYSVIFSDGLLDRCRFDNYDDRWSISTHPHHVHIRMSSQAFASKMTGNPKKDMPILCDLIKKGKLFSNTFTF